MSKLEREKMAIIIFPFIGHLLAILLLGVANYPWYYLALIPFLSIASAWSLIQFIFKPSWVWIIGLTLIPFSSTFYWGYTTFHQPAQILNYRIFILSILFMGFVRLKFNYKLTQFVWLAFCGALLFFIFRWNTHAILYLISKWGEFGYPQFPAI